MQIEGSNFKIPSTLKLLDEKCHCGMHWRWKYHIRRMKHQCVKTALHPIFIRMLKIADSLTLFRIFILLIIRTM